VTKSANDWVKLGESDLATFGRIRGPLRLWLLDSHGRRGLREGTIGAASAVMSLAWVHVFDGSALWVMLHMVIALIAEGVGSVVETRRSPAASGKPFLTPAHALALARGVVGAFALPRWHEHHGRIAAKQMAGARSLAKGSAAVPAHEGLKVSLVSALPKPLAAVLTILKWIVVSAISVLMLVLLGGWFWMLVKPMVLLFDRAQWWGLALFATINALHSWSVWRECKSTPASEPWQYRWFIDETPRLGQLGWWNHDKRLMLFAAWIIVLFMFILTGAASNDAPGLGVAYAARFEARLVPILTVLLAGSALLHLLLLAAPRHARRLVLMLDAFDPGTAAKAIKGPRRPSDQVRASSGASTKPPRG